MASPTFAHAADASPQPSARRERQRRARATATVATAPTSRSPPAKFSAAEDELLVDLVAHFRPDLQPKGEARAKMWRDIVDELRDNNVDVKNAQGLQLHFNALLRAMDPSHKHHDAVAESVRDKLEQFVELTSMPLPPPHATNAAEPAPVGSGGGSQSRRRSTRVAGRVTTTVEAVSVTGGSADAVDGGIEDTRRDPATSDVQHRRDQEHAERMALIEAHHAFLEKYGQLRRA